MHRIVASVTKLSATKARLVYDFLICGCRFSCLEDLLFKIVISANVQLDLQNLCRNLVRLGGRGVEYIRAGVG